MSFNTSNIQADTFTGVVSVTAPKHVVGTVELTQDGDNLSVIGVNSEIVNTDDVVAAVSVSTPLLTSPELFPMTVENLQTISLTSGAGTAGQVLALDSSLNLVWVDDANTPQGLESVLTTSNDAGGLEITNLLKLTPVSGVGTVGQVLSCDASGNLDWVTLAKPAVPTLSEVLLAGDDGDGNDILNVGQVEAVSLKLTDTTEWNLVPNPANNNLELSSVQSGYLDLVSTSLVTTGQIMSSLLIGKKPSYDYWVSPNGSNSDAVSNGGSLENPFQTIAACLNYCETLTASDNQYRYIHILGGTYNESLTISKKVYLQGEATTSQSASVGCQINGNITVQVNANGSDMFNNGVHLSGLLVNGTITNQSGENHMLILENVYIYTPNDVDGRGLYHNPSSVNSRLKLWNCQIISGGSSGLLPLLESTSVGQISMNYCYLSAKGNQNCLLLSQTATCDSINNCKFESATNATITAQGICKITSVVSGTYTFSNCAFVYTNPSNKSASAVASGILNQNLSGNNTIIALYNTFLLTGTDVNNNYAIQDVNHGSPSQCIVLYYMNGATPSTAFAIKGNNNQTKFQLQVCS